MAYKWEKESLQKYGKEVTLRLIKQQQEYEEKHRGNNCETCGEKNEGTVVELEKDKPFIMHYGLWTNGYCDYCKKPQ
ncbi:hypothetical protein P9265_14755 [Schinkia azotoformans]|uniref:hypothetical protein n=1 Tax=Schinkia azotoformans TaxID=1454 RepID=UPI002E2304D6|nr:hypothetical protein [Schinkia azotoformans]